MTASVFRAAILSALSFGFGCAGCDTAEKQGDPWALADDMSIDATSDSTIEQTPDMVRAPDMGPADAGPTDAGPRDMPPPDDLPPETITTVGWYTSAFEHSGFIEDPDGELTLGDRPCSPYRPSGEGDQWWISGQLESNDFVDAADGTGARMRLTGVLSEPGEHGHLGGYSHELTITDAERLACETARLGGHCLRPSRGDLCVVPQINDPDASQKYELTVTYGGVQAGARFELRLTFNEEVGDGRTDAVVRWRLQDDFIQFAEAGALAELQLVQEQHGLFYNEIDYENLDGWVMYTDADNDAWYVSISGEDEDGAPLHVWGAFDVTDTIALP